MRARDFFTIHKAIHKNEGLKDKGLPPECLGKIASFLTSLSSRVHVNLFKREGFPVTCIDHIASYLPSLSGPPVYTIAQHLGLESDQQIFELYSSLCDLAVRWGKQ